MVCVNCTSLYWCDKGVVSFNLVWNENQNTVTTVTSIMWEPSNLTLSLFLSLSLLVSLSLSLCPVYMLPYSQIDDAPIMVIDTKWYTQIDGYWYSKFHWFLANDWSCDPECRVAALAYKPEVRVGVPSPNAVLHKRPKTLSSLCTDDHVHLTRQDSWMSRAFVPHFGRSGNPNLAGSNQWL